GWAWSRKRAGRTERGARRIAGKKNLELRMGRGKFEVQIRFANTSAIRCLPTLNTTRSIERLHPFSCSDRACWRQVPPLAKIIFRASFASMRLVPIGALAGLH